MRPLPLTLAAVAAACVAAAPATALTAKLTSRVIPPKKAATLTIATPAMGEFAYRLRASSDGSKRLRVVQRRGTSAFTVMKVPGAIAQGACQGAAGSIFCTGITTPAPVKARYIIRVFNDSTRPMTVTLQVTFRRVTSAG